MLAGFEGTSRSGHDVAFPGAEVGDVLATEGTLEGAESRPGMVRLVRWCEAEQVSGPNACVVGVEQRARDEGLVRTQFSMLHGHRGVGEEPLGGAVVDEGGAQRGAVLPRRVEGRRVHRHHRGSHRMQVAGRAGDDVLVPRSLRQERGEDGDVVRVAARPHLQALLRVVAVNRADAARRRGEDGVRARSQVDEASVLRLVIVQRRVESVCLEHVPPQRQVRPEGLAFAAARLDANPPGSPSTSMGVDGAQGVVECAGVTADRPVRHVQVGADRALLLDAQCRPPVSLQCRRLLAELALDLGPRVGLQWRFEREHSRFRSSGR